MRSARVDTRHRWGRTPLPLSGCRVCPPPSPANARRTAPRAGPARRPASAGDARAWLRDGRAHRRSTAPARTPQPPDRESAGPAPRSAGADLQGPRDQLLHDFIRAGIDALHPAVGPHASDRILRHVAVSAVQLNALVDDAALGVAQPVFRHRGGDFVALARDETLDAVVEEPPADMRFRLALGQLEARILQVDQWLAERRALFHVLGCDGHRLLRGRDRDDAHAQALIG